MQAIAQLFRRGWEIPGTRLTKDVNTSLKYKNNNMKTVPRAHLVGVYQLSSLAGSAWKLNASKVVPES